MSPILIAVISITLIISVIGFQNPAFFDKYKFNVGAITKQKEYVRLLSAGFLHASWSHLFFNMLTLYFFGPIVIYAFGVPAFLVIYLGSMVFGNLFSLYIYKNQAWYTAIGASGGVSGVLFAAVAFAPTEVSVNFLPGYLFGAVYFGYSVYSMLNPRMGDNTGHAAHLGGAVFGLLYAVGFAPEMAVHNAFYLAIMALPLLYLAYEIFIKKRIG